ncbi:MAG: DUF5385 family protein [Mycoplasmataceae bacterium]|nr:DUF5385 family protein [Mycoplasmataceae bacterium]
MGSYLPIIIIIALAVIVIPIWLKKRKSKHTSIPISAHKNKDEVWKAVKQYLRDVNENGKEIVDCYVAKRNDVNHINTNTSMYLRAKKHEEIKIRKWQQKQKLLASNNPHKIKQKDRDLYVVCFTTREAKSKQVDLPRAIECEVVNTKINRKTYDRKILINGILNYDKEMEWIAPIKFAEANKNSKSIKAQQKQEARKKIQTERLLAKQKAKQAKQAAKTKKDA